LVEVLEGITTQTVLTEAAVAVVLFVEMQQPLLVALQFKLQIMVEQVMVSVEETWLAVLEVTQELAVEVLAEREQTQLLQV
jgi:hypothetical protein